MARVDAFCVDREYINEKKLLGKPVMPYENLGVMCPPGEFDVILGVGFAGKGKLRITRFEELTDLGYKFVSCISKYAVVWNKSNIGLGTTVSAGCYISSSAVIRENVYIGANSVVPHDCVISEHVFMSAGVILSGKVTIKRGAFLGTGCVVRNGITIGENTIIGAGAVLLEDAEDNAVYMSPVAEKLPLKRDAIDME